MVTIRGTLEATLDAAEMTLAAVGSLNRGERSTWLNSQRVHRGIDLRHGRAMCASRQTEIKTRVLNDLGVPRMI
jgi:hypothetical protein